ncbi:MAG: hypothetical protein MZV70_07330 [Desulfobacterales bacterium]|nr:hypothetical protein [Desulfobacterales bacterium]
MNGVEVVMTSISRETYIPDFAFLVQKMAKMENLEVIFALALMESKIYIVARSRIEEVDVGAVLAGPGRRRPRLRRRGHRQGPDPRPDRAPAARSSSTRGSRRGAWPASLMSVAGHRRRAGGLLRRGQQAADPLQHQRTAGRRASATAARSCAATSRAR